MNNIVLIGRLVKDPDSREVGNNGITRCFFTLAVDRRFKGANGEKEADFIDVVAWRQLGETCMKYLRKGQMAAVQGSLQIRSYQTQDGSTRRVAEVVADQVRFLGGKTGAGQGNGRQEAVQTERVNQMPYPIDSDDDLPF